ncbi:MAG: endolytic transglycosylase MltG [Ruminococcaceae bacterium]|nr:endolytic transglycosylase MltG [Oscillospiraceae bacterium]
MENKNINPPSGDDTSWLDDLLASSNYGEDAIEDLSSSVEDMELERIIREAKADEWDLTDIIESQQPDYEDPAPAPQPAFEDPEVAAQVYWEEDEEAAPQEETEEEIFEESDRKVRPKRKSSYGLFGLPHLASILIWIGIVAVCGISLGRLLWICATDVLAFGREDRVTTITITNSDVGNIDAIADKLYNAGLIKYKQLFRFYASLSSADEKISAGTFELNTLFDYNALVKGMSSTSSYRESVKVTIPEGYTCAQIFALLEEKGVCSAAELKAYEVQSEYWFLEGTNENAEYPLEGFLFPDTYNFYIGDSAKGVFRRFLARFDDIFTDELKTYVDSSKYSLYEIMTIASMIEKESAGSSENYDISSVIYNRLNNPASFPFLDIDATIVYAQGGNNEFIDKDLDSPYNTYKYKGLPPTPICNPSLLSIQAALAPTDTKYHYYALDPSTGLHHFSKTYAEHLAFLESIK